MSAISWPIMWSNSTTNSASNLRRRDVPKHKISSARRVLRLPLSRRSFGSPSSFHRRRELRTTLRREIEFSLHLFGDAPSLRARRSYWRLCCYAVFFLLHRCQRLGRLASFGSASGHFSPGLHRVCFRHRFKSPFQLGELRRAFLQASFEFPDLFLESLKLHRRSTVLRLTHLVDLCRTRRSEFDMDAGVRRPRFLLSTRMLPCSQHTASWSDRRRSSLPARRSLPGPCAPPCLCRDRPRAA
jgi:hypothetical protein